MIAIRSVTIVALLSLFVVVADSQSVSGGGSSAAITPDQLTKPSYDTGPIRSSAAYAEVLLRKTELQAELESLINDYTDENPKIIDLRFEIATLTKDIDRMFTVKPTETSKLTEALGKLIVKRAALATEALQLSRSYSAEHPTLKRAKRKAEIFDKAIKEIMG